jgi:hypothetical protein
MKRFAIASLSILCLSLVATTSVKAETKTEHISMWATTMTVDPTHSGITPFELVSRGYQGVYRMQGIPGFGSFPIAYSGKMITAKDLVNAAIQANQLAPETQNDRDYLNAVDLQLSGRQH